MIRKFAKIAGENPPRGWIYNIRVALGMSLSQLGIIVNKTPQGIRDIELREMTGNITIASLEQIGKQLNMKLVYGFVPVEGSFRQMAGRRSRTTTKAAANGNRAGNGTQNQAATAPAVPRSAETKTPEFRYEYPDLLWEED